MVGIYGIVGGPARANSAGSKAAPGDRSRSEGAPPVDDVSITAEARDVSRMAQVAARADEAQPDIRADRVAQAKQHIENGAYRLRAVVEVVAARITKYVTP